MRGIQFNLVKSTDGNYYWTVELPTQINKESSRAEAERNLALTVKKLLTRKFKVAEFDLNTPGFERDYLGGITHLLTKAVDENASGGNSAPTSASVSRSKNGSRPVPRVAKRNRR